MLCLKRQAMLSLPSTPLKLIRKTMLLTNYVVTFFLNLPKQLSGLQVADA